jgi:hypothetical protein
MVARAVRYFHVANLLNLEKSPECVENEMLANGFERQTASAAVAEVLNERATYARAAELLKSAASPDETLAKLVAGGFDRQAASGLVRTYFQTLQQAGNLGEQRRLNQRAAMISGVLACHAAELLTSTVSSKERHAKLVAGGLDLQIRAAVHDVFQAQYQPLSEPDSRYIGQRQTRAAVPDVFRAQSQPLSEPDIRYVRQPQTLTQQAVPIFGAIAGIGLAAATTYLYGFRGRETFEQILLLTFWLLAPMSGAVIGGTLVGSRWLPEWVNPARILKDQVAGLVALVITCGLVAILLVSLDENFVKRLLAGPFARPNRLWFAVLLVPVSIVWVIIRGLICYFLDRLRRAGKREGAPEAADDESSPF